MQLSAIGPLQVISQFPSRYHLALAVEILNVQMYRAFYAQRIIAGDYVILDNSAHELGVGDLDRLLRAAQEIRPDVVVLPDRLFWGDDTVDLSTEAVLYQNRAFDAFSKMVVPQGRTPREWHQCLCDLLELHPTVIGISKDYEVWRGGIRHLIKIVQAEAPNTKIHLLGLGRDLSKYRHIADTGVDGLDTSKPIVYGINGIALTRKMRELPKYPKRTPMFFTQTLSQSIIDLCIDNLEVTKFYLGIV